jgi:hypothetical protein
MLNIARLLKTASFTGLCAFVVACGGNSPELASAKSGESGSGSSAALEIVSNRADLISGGDVLVHVTSTEAPVVLLNGIDISDQFEPYVDGGYRALVTGLQLGTNLISAESDAGSSAITVTNAPHGGPVFSGPQLEPWRCNNGSAEDDACNQPPEYSYVYKSSINQQFQAYDPENPPSDIATTTTDEGLEVPFIVRIETGYQNRDQYAIATLIQPAEDWTPANPQQQYNGKVLVTHGASCGTDYGSGSAPDVSPSNGTNAEALGRGYIVASTALNNAGHNCNLALQAESIVMVKERIIEQYGDLRYTIAAGCSGGSLALQWMANAYPGLYQGLLPTCSFPDTWSTATQFLDYHQTIDYFFSVPPRWGAGIAWTENQMAAVQGHIAVVNSQVSETAQFSVAVATEGCNNDAVDDAYHPDDNPDGVRCAIQDAAINVFGPRPQELWSSMEQAVGYGFAGFPVDNVGVQYGLLPLQQGIILPAQFLDLNEKIGGIDVDTVFTEERIEAVQPALENAYRSGMINSTNNLDQVAIIDCRGPDPGAFHDAYRAYAIRERLRREHGHHDNHLIWEGPVALLGDAQCGKLSFIAMDRWLAAVEQDNSAAPVAEKVVSNKPADLTDACLSGAGQQLQNSTCGQAIVGVFGTPRTAAGDAITTDNNKCQLKPLDRNDNYGPLGFDDGQWARMEALFADGVCDFSVPGVSQQGTVPWMTYQDAQGNVIYGGTPMPAVPTASGTGWASPSFQVFE